MHPTTRPPPPPSWRHRLAAGAGRLGARLGVPAPRHGRRTVDFAAADLVAFVDDVDRALDRARPDGHVAVVAVNDAAGTLDRRALAQARDVLAVARLDAATWVVGLPGTSVEGLLRDLAARAKEAVPPLRCGVAIGPEDAPTATRLVHLAELAALSILEGVRWHRPYARDGLRARRELVEGLRASLHVGEVEPWFQALVCTRTQAVVGAEALVRWRHPTAGVLVPGLFLPTIVGSGSALDLGRDVVRRAVGKAARWRALGRDVLVSVNVFPEQLRERWTLDALDEARRLALPPGAVRLEVPIDPLDDAARRGVRRLVAAGVPFALDAHDGRPDALREAAALGFRAVKLDLDAFRAGTVHVDWGGVRAAVDRVVAAGLEAELYRVTCTTELARARRLHGVRRVQGHAIDLPVDARTFEERHLDAPPVS